MTERDRPQPGGEILLYRTEDGQTRLETRMTGDTVWLSLGQMTTLFQRDKSVISRHIRNIFAEDELHPGATVAKFATVQTEGGKSVSRDIEHYNLDVIISVGYRVKSHRGVQFRIWATQRLREYIVKGFALDDERLKRGGGGHYFDELLARIRDIRSSEKVFWRKVLDIYATSIDYNPAEEASQRFFATVQNKMHWAAHGQTAAANLKNGKAHVVCEQGQLIKVSKDKDGVVTRETLTKHWTDWVDYWAVNFDYMSRKEIIRVAKDAGEEKNSAGSVEYEERWTGGYIFENEWQSFRTRKNRDLELTSAPHAYARAGRYTVAVKVIDIFGNDTMTLVPVNVG